MRPTAQFKSHAVVARQEIIRLKPLQLSPEGYELKWKVSVGVSPRVRTGEARKLPTGSNPGAMGLFFQA
jgi:hypothetical protein